MSDHPRAIGVCKILSVNDTGENGAHQAGILIPKDKSLLSFFPKLTMHEKNPRVKLCFLDKNGQYWYFNFIYYNNKFFGGTRNEFRLTGMTQYIKSNSLKAGDKVFFKHGNSDIAYISFEKQESIILTENHEPYSNSITRIKLTNAWKVINI